MSIHVESIFLNKTFYSEPSEHIFNRHLNGNHFQRNLKLMKLSTKLNIFRFLKTVSEETPICNLEFNGMVQILERGVGIPPKRYAPVPTY